MDVSFGRIFATIVGIGEVAEILCLDEYFAEILKLNCFLEILRILEFEMLELHLSFLKLLKL